VSTASLQHISVSSVSQWRMSVVDHVLGLRQLAAFHYLEFRVRPLRVSEASHRADLRCGTISHQPCANIIIFMSLAAFKSKLKTYLFSRLQWLMMATRRCYGVFLWFRRRNINDFTYLLTFDCYRPRWPWMTLSGVIALISRFFTEFDCFAGQICHSGWRWTYYVRKYCLPVPVFHFWP